MTIINVLSKSEIERIIDEKILFRFNNVYQELSLLRLKLDKLIEENKIMKGKYLRKW